METLYNDNTPLRVSITPAAANFLDNTAKWGKFLAIVGFVTIALMVLGGLFAGAAMSSAMGTMGGAAGALGGGFFTFFYLLFALLYFFPVLYLYRFSARVQEALRIKDEALLADAFRNLKSLFKFMGVLTILMLAFYGLAVLFMVLGVGIGSMM